MKSLIRHPVVAASLVAAAGLIFVACSDSTTAPTSPVQAPLSGAAFALGTTTIPAGSTTIAINSSGSTQYCGIAAGNVNPSAPPGTTFVGSCGGANDVSTAANGLNAYNPGWDHPFTGSDWIGPTGADSPSNQYFARPGTYDFQTTFTIPAGATGVGLNISAMGDNVVQVFLNGHAVGADTPIQDCPPSGACNWLQANALVLTDVTQSDFVIGGTNTLEIFLIDTFIGVGPTGSAAPPGFNGSSCTLGPQAHGTLGFSTTTVTTNPNFQAGGAAWSSATCLNPTGLDFSGVAFYTPAPVVNHGCTLGFWKNHDGNGPQPFVWPSPYTTSTTLLAAGFIGTGNDGVTLDAALSFKGGSTVQDAKNNLMKQAVAALLNAATVGEDYPLTVAQVLHDVNAALASNNSATILAEAAVLDGFNSLEGGILGC